MEDTEKEMWKTHKNDMDLMRQKRRWQFIRIIKNLKQAGFEVVEVSEFQFRINDAIDIYPSNKRYHDLRENIRGDIRGQDFEGFVKGFFGIKSYGSQKNN